MQRILLLGATGRVGRMVLHHWHAAPSDIVEIVEQHRDTRRSTGLYWSLCEEPKRPLAAMEIDAIVCLAGVTPGDGKNLSLNSKIARNVLSCAFRAGIGRVLLASSSAVYGAGAGLPLNEKNALNPVNAYGEAKLNMEEVCTVWRRKGLGICCLRIGNVAGADALLLNATKMKSSQPLRIDCFADGNGPVRSYIGAATLANVLMDLATQQNAIPDVLNIATPTVVSMADLARAADHPFEYYPALHDAHQSITLDCQALMKYHAFSSDASDPTQMVAQWKETLPQ